MKTYAARSDRTSVGKTSRLKAIYTRAKRNPHWFVMESFSRFPLVRTTVRLLNRSAASDDHDVAASVFPNLNVPECVEALERDGYCQGLHLPAEVTEEILEFAANATCYGDAQPACGFRYQHKQAAQQASGRVFSQATYFFLEELQPTVRRLCKDPGLLAISARYFGTTPVMTGSRLWWVFATPEADYNSSVTTSFFHYDKDDYSAVRFFFYLTRVDSEHGPHVVVRGSHARKRLSQLISFGERSDRQIVDYYGPERLTTIFGEPGTGFGEDPFCFHKATRPVAGDRLMLEIKFATRDYNIFPQPDRSKVLSIVAETLQQKTAEALQKAHEI
jgi:hypothetical protein